MIGADIGGADIVRILSYICPCFVYSLMGLEWAVGGPWVGHEWAVGGRWQWA